MTLFDWLSPEDRGSVGGAPDLPNGFRDIFRSRFVDTWHVRLHAAIGGEGPPLLLIHGWPETWYAWRAVMPALARHFHVVAVDQRGIGLSDKPTDGYDTGTLARDLIGLMNALGHDRFAVVGHDTGFAIAYALAADHPERVERIALLEIPGAPGTVAVPPLSLRSPLDEPCRPVGFSAIQREGEDLAADRAETLLRWGFDAAGTPLPDDTIDYYVKQLSSAESLRGSFGWFRAIDDTIAQDEQRRQQPLPMPVLAVGGERSFGELVGCAVRVVAPHAESVVIPDTGHFVAEESPDALLSSLAPFLAAHRPAAAP